MYICRRCAKARVRCVVHKLEWLPSIAARSRNCREHVDVFLFFLHANCEICAAERAKAFGGGGGGGGWAFISLNSRFESEIIHVVSLRVTISGCVMQPWTSFARLPSQDGFAELKNSCS